MPENRHGLEKLTQYLALAKARPTMFANPPGAGFFILLDEGDIRHVETEVEQRLQQQGLPVSWAHVGVIYEDQYLLILRDAVRFVDGHLGTYIRTVRYSDGATGVVILPVYNGQVLLIRHFRHATRAWHLEIPRGFGTKGLSNEASARLELEEETGATASRFINLGQMHVDTGMSSEYVELFYAEAISVGKPEVREAISELLLVKPSEFERLICEGDITDSFTIATYTRAKLRGFL